MSEQEAPGAERLPPSEDERADLAIEDARTDLPALNHLEMYQLPGDLPLSEKDVARYVKSVDRIGDNAAKDIEAGLQDRNQPIHNRLKLLQLLDLATPEERNKLQPLVADFLDEAAGYKNDVAGEENQFHPDLALDAVTRLDADRRTSFLRKGLKIKSYWYRRIAAGYIHLVPEQDRTALLAEALNDEHEVVRSFAIRELQYVPVPDRAALLMRCLDEGGESDRSYAALELDHVPVAERGPILVKHGEWIIAKQEEERQRIAKSKEPAAVIDRSPRETDDVLYWLEAGSEEQRLQAAKDISNVPASDCARLFEVALQDKSSRVRQAAAYNLEHAPAETLAKLVAIAIRDAERSVVDNAEHIIGAVPEESDRKELIAVINDKRRLSRLAANSELYRPDEGRYVSRDFAKTGSGTTLLDKVPGMPEASLRNRAIIRHIESGPFAEWRRIFEDAERWRAAGFDYVPIEPIVKADRQGAEVDVVTRVLRGPSVRKWRQFTSLYAPEIDNQIRMIKGVMKKIDLDHRHDHEGNFIVVFDRDSQGRPILERQPRVYMIDFDLARSRSDG